MKKRFAAGLGIISLVASSMAYAGISNINFGETALTVDFYHPTCSTPPEFTINVSKVKGTDTITFGGNTDTCTETPLVETSVTFDYATHGINPNTEYDIVNVINGF
jgi:hypothetical protein